MTTDDDSSTSSKLQQTEEEDVEADMLEAAGELPPPPDEFNVEGRSSVVTPTLMRSGWPQDGDRADVHVGDRRRMCSHGRDRTWWWARPIATGSSPRQQR